jgi:hypothetical protein
MMPPYSCSTPGRKPGTSTKVTSGMLKALQKRMKREALSDGVNVEHAGHLAGLVGDDTDGRPQTRAKPTTTLGAKPDWTSRKFGVIDDAEEDFANIVGAFAVEGDDVVEGGVGLAGVVTGLDGRLFEIVLGEEAQEFLAEKDGLLVVFGDEVDDAGVDHVRVGAAEFIGGDGFAGDLFDDLGPGDEHLGFAGHG